VGDGECAIHNIHLCILLYRREQTSVAYIGGRPGTDSMVVGMVCEHWVRAPPQSRDALHPSRHPRQPLLLSRAMLCLLLVPSPPVPPPLTRRSYSTSIDERIRSYSCAPVPPPLTRRSYNRRIRSTSIDETYTFIRLRLAQSLSPRAVAVTSQTDARRERSRAKLEVCWSRKRRTPSARARQGGHSHRSHAAVWRRWEGVVGSWVVRGGRGWAVGWCRHSLTSTVADWAHKRRNCDDSVAKTKSAKYKLCPTR